MPSTGAPDPAPARTLETRSDGCDGRRRIRDGAGMGLRIEANPSMWEYDHRPDEQKPNHGHDSQWIGAVFRGDRFR